jgi:hypothetical protein
MWLIIETDSTVEIVPDFGRQHVLVGDNDGPCWCVPRIEENDRDLVIHEADN